MVYLDVCALNRPFDDQGQIRIRMESDAVHLILEHVRSGVLSMTVSRVHSVEIAANPDVATREHIEYLVSSLGNEVPVDSGTTQSRARELFNRGMGVADAAHVAFAEATKSDFVTVDDRLLGQCRRLGVRTWCGTPMAYVEKEELR
jgi:predicted nucleic acid-binding protein